METRHSRTCQLPARASVTIAVRDRHRRCTCRSELTRGWGRPAACAKTMAPMSGRAELESLSRLWR